jgi:stage II sporulation protein D
MIAVRADNGGLIVNTERLDQTSLIVRGGRDDRVQVNGRWYRSWMRVFADKDRIQVINYVSLEHYLYGVLPREVYTSWPAAALQAQAVAARTYALYHMLMRSNRDFDVLSTTSSQVYGGFDREHPATNSAVDATRSLVLFNDTQLALTLFHANSGGVVESVEDVWGARLPYLVRVVDTPSLQGRHAQWSSTIGVDQMSERLARYGLHCNGLEELFVLKRSAGGRVQQIEMKGPGTSVLLSGNSLRLMLGPSVVKSTLFIVEHTQGSYTFTGAGYGHGVGMSQWGACVLAKSGADYRQILEHYYPGTELALWDNQNP